MPAGGPAGRAVDPPLSRDSAARGGTLLSVEGVTKRYGGVLAVDEVSLDVRRGETLGVIGPNGAGKSTLLKLVTGEERLDRGRIELEGIRLDKLPAHRMAHAGVGFAHQIPRPFGRLTVRENLRVASGAARARRGQEGTQFGVDESLLLTGLAGKADRPARTLNVLDLKRLELARALCVSPRLLLLDEVGAGLGHEELRSMIAIVGEIRTRGVTIVVVEHVESVIRTLAERVLVLDWGRLVAEGTPDEIAADATVRAIYLGHRGDLAPVRSARPRAGDGATDRRLLSVERVRAQYGGAIALEGIDLEVHEGEIVAVLGANGAGKTTLTRVVSGLMRPAAGRISFAGRDITRLSPDRRVALGIAHCQEGRRVFADLTVGENLRMGAYARRARAAEAARERWIFQLFPALAERPDQLAGSLSGGQQQMLAIGRALMSRPKLLILDELSLGLAPKVVDAVYETLTAINEEGTAILLVEQNAYRTLSVADYVYVLDDGRQVFSGLPASLGDEERLSEIYFGRGDGR